MLTEGFQKAIFIFNYTLKINCNTCINYSSVTVIVGRSCWSFSLSSYEAIYLTSLSWISDVLENPRLLDLFYPIATERFKPEFSKIRNASIRQLHYRLLPFVFFPVSGVFGKPNYFDNSITPTPVNDTYLFTAQYPQLLCSQVLLWYSDHRYVRVRNASSNHENSRMVQGHFAAEISWELRSRVCQSHGQM